MDIELIEILAPSDNPTEPDICTGSVCVVTWHPVQPIGAACLGDGFKVIQAA